MIINGLIVAAVVVVGAVLFVGIGMLLNRRDNRRDDERMAIEDADTLQWARELHHDIWETPPTRIQVTEVGIPDSLAYRYGKVGDNGPAPYEKHIPQTPAAAPHPPAPAPPPVTDPAAAVEQVSPAVPVLPPPPVPLHETHQAATAVGAAIAATAKRIAEKERAKAEAWAAEVEATSPWEDQPPFGDWERGDSITMPAIRVDGDCDGPLSIPPEVLHEMEAGV